MPSRPVPFKASICRVLGITRKIAWNKSDMFLLSYYS